MGGIICVDKRKSLRYLPPVLNFAKAYAIIAANGIKKKIKEIKPTLPPDTTLEVSFDRSNYIKAAIYEVYKTLVIALILVTIIIYLFLGNIRALIVPLIALPVSLISTFLSIYIFGFSINLFTLMALVLAIGIVVDGLKI